MDRRQPGQLRPMTVTPSLTARRAQMLATPLAIPMPRGGVGPTPSPEASPASGLPVVTARSTPTRPSGRRGRHAAPVRRGDGDGTRTALTVAVALVLGSAGTVLGLSAIDQRSPTAAALYAQ